MQATGGPARRTPAAAADRVWLPRRDPCVWLIMAVYFGIAITSIYIHELGYGPDEVTRHLPYVEWLAKEHCLPPADPTQECGPLELHPPLYYLALVPVYLLAEPFGRRTALLALRWTSPFLVGLTLLLWLPVIRRACGGRRGTTLFAFALTAWWPNLYVDAALLNNDVGAMLVLAAILYLTAIRFRDSRSLGSAAILGALIGVGGLVKTSVPIAALPVALVALAWQHGRRCWADGRFWTRAFLGLAACVAVCGWWFLRNLELHGSLTVITPSLGYCLIPEGVTRLEALMGGYVGPLAMRAINGLWVSVFAGAVWFPDWSHPLVYGLLRALTALGVIGVLVGLWRLARDTAQFARHQAPAIVLPAVGFGTIYLSAIWMSVFVHAGFYQGGRYLLPFLPGLTICLALGLRQLCPRPARNVGAILLLLFFLGLNALAWYHIITYWNPFVLNTAGRFQ